MLRLVVLALVAFMTLPTVVVIAVSFNPTPSSPSRPPDSPGAGT